MSRSERERKRAPRYGPARPWRSLDPNQPYPEPSWSGWGDASLKPVLDRATCSQLAPSLGVREPGRPAGSIGE